MAQNMRSNPNSPYNPPEVNRNSSLNLLRFDPNAIFPLQDHRLTCSNARVSSRTDPYPIPTVLFSGSLRLNRPPISKSCRLPTSTIKLILPAIPRRSTILILLPSR